MNRTRRLLVLIVLLLAGAALYAYVTARPATLVLTGIVTTNDIIVSPQIGGRIAELLVKEGDRGQERSAARRDRRRRAAARTRAYYAQSAEGLSSQVRESRGGAAAISARQTADQIAQAESMLASTEAQVDAAAADAGERQADLDADAGSREAAASSRRRSSIRRGPLSRRPPRKLDRCGSRWRRSAPPWHWRERTRSRWRCDASQVQTNEQHQAAAAAQQAKADVRLRYTEMHAPIDGIVDVRAARPGEVRQRRASRSSR